MAQLKNCFIICPIGEEGSETRKRSDQVLKHVITPPLEQCGYKPVRADKISEPGMITSQVIQHIIDDDLVIADLTSSNANVFYELAIRHAVRKPLVQLIQKGEKIPFDVADMRTISVDHHDLDSVEECRVSIVDQIKASENKPPEQIESPISTSIELQQLRQSENPEDRSYAELLDVITSLRADVNSVEKRLARPEAILPPEYLTKVTGRSRKSSERNSILLHELKFMLNQLKELKDNSDSKKRDIILHELEHMTRMLHHEIDF